MNKNDITQIQTWLKQQGYYRSTIDGLMGPRTEQAIKSLQRQFGLAQDGIVGPDTRRIMASVEQRAESRGNLYKIQVTLFSLGIYNGKCDGIAGPMTVSAIKVFQRQNGLDDDGIAGPRTLAKLFPKDDGPDIQVTPPPTSSPSSSKFYLGNAKRLDLEDIPRIANNIKLKVSIVKAFLQVESNGKPFDAKNRPTVLYEPHLAYRFTSGEIRAELMSEGLAYVKWGTKPYPKTMDDRYKQIDLCTKIAGAEVAADSSSWGGPQICGFNARSCGYIDGVSMVRAFAADEENQMAAMGSFILNNATLYNALKRLDFATAAECYNGAAYRKNKYDEKLESAYLEFEKG